LVYSFTLFACANIVLSANLKGVLHKGSSINGKKLYLLINEPVLTQPDAIITDFLLSNYNSLYKDKDLTSMVEICFINITIKYLPVQYYKFSNQIQKLVVDNTQLREIKQNNLNMFSNLEHLAIRRNLIETLEGNLFDENPHIKLLELNGNKIKFVEAKIAENLKKLDMFNFSDNPCFSAIAANYKEVQALMKNLMKNCRKKSENEKIEETVAVNSNQEKSRNTMINSDGEQMNQISREIKDLKQEISLFRKQQFDTLSAKVEKLTNDFNSLSSKIEPQFRGITEKLNKLNDLESKLDNKAEKQKTEVELSKVKEETKGSSMIHATSSEVRELEIRLKTELLNLKNQLTNQLIHSDKVSAGLPSENLSNDSATAVIATQSVIISIFIILLLIASVFMYLNRSNFMVMSRTYKLPDNEKLIKSQSSATMQVQLSTENLCEIGNDNVVRYQNVKPLAKSSPISIKPKSLPMTPVKQQKLTVAPLKPEPTPTTSRKIGENLFGTPPLTPKSPKISSTEIEAVLNARRTVGSHLMTKNNENKNNDETYGTVWKSGKAKDEYGVVQKKK
jgi:hypothetical protein